MIQMDVQGGEDRMVEVMLYAGQFLIQHADVVIVNQSNGTDDMAVGRFPDLLHELVANQIAESLGAVRVAALADQAVELVQQFRIDGYANPAEAAHAYTY